ncbi:hypothetical protein NVP1101O_013 [Vibrio phage 1.101.O._10N.261.45.C6]|nr:hypothetical protein NVP1101O_013 [Vibrio phage 1.101.O._10N.261.45.C6]
MREEVKIQQNIAREVLHKLEITDPNCILAGGAPRDWWFDSKANDLDFYVYWGSHTTCAEDKRRLDLLGFEGYRLMSQNPLSELYGSIPELRRVWEIDYEGEYIQIMVMSAPTFNCVIPRFGCSVSKIWWKGYQLHPTTEFLASHHLKVNIIKGDYNAKESYVKKMASRFPDYEEYQETALDSVLVDYEDQCKTPNWIMLNLGDNQNYENSCKLFKEERSYCVTLK